MESISRKLEKHSEFQTKWYFSVHFIYLTTFEQLSESFFQIFLDHFIYLTFERLSESFFQISNSIVECQKKIAVAYVGKPVITYYEESPYRAEIVSQESPGEFYVRFVEYGNETSKLLEELLPVDRDEQAEVNGKIVQQRLLSEIRWTSFFLQLVLECSFFLFASLSS